MLTRDADRLHPLAELFLFGDRLFETNWQPRRIPSGYPSATCRRAHGSCGICVCEPHSLRRELIEIRSLIIGTAVATEICPAHVIGENEKDVWSRCCGCW